MEEQQPTILEQTQDIRARYQRGDITPEEAKRLIKPYYEEYKKVVKEKAKASHTRAPSMSLEKFLSRRSDLRYVAQQQVSEQHQAEEGSDA